MSEPDTRKETVTLYRSVKGNVDFGDFISAVEPVGVFRRINWCKTHDDAKHPLADYCWQRWAALLVEDDPVSCELVELWQEQP